MTGAQQRLVSLALELRAAQATVPRDLGELKAELSRVADGLASALDGQDRVETLGGTISVQSAPAAGTAVVVELPLDDDCGDSPAGVFQPAGT